MPDEEIDLGTNEEVAPVIDLEDKPRLEISLKHWNSRAQCISDWRPKELEALRRFVDKVQELTPTTMKTDASLNYKLHSAPTRTKGFNRPASIAKDISLFELRVSSKARVHCYLSNEQLYLVWLDRNHEVFP